MTRRYALTAMAVAGILTTTTPLLAQTGSAVIDVDGDAALRCAVSRAVALSRVDLLGNVVDGVGIGASFEAIARGDVAAAKDEHVGLLRALGLVTQNDVALTQTGRALAEQRSASDRAIATVALELGTSLDHSIALPGVPARFQTTTAQTGSYRIVVTPSGAGSEDCVGDFDPVVRATLEGVTGLEHVARAAGDEHGAALYLYDVLEGTKLDIAVNDVVGAPGSFRITVEQVFEEAPFVDGGEAFVFVGDGLPAYQPIEIEAGESAVVSLTISYDAWEPWFSVIGVVGVQPGVRIYESDGYGGVLGEPVYRSSYLPNAEARVDVDQVFYGGDYLMVIEDLQRNAGTFLVEYSSDGYAPGPRIYGDLILNEESLQSLGSDLAFTVEEQGWYYFSTTSYDDVDPVMALLDADGWYLYEIDDDAFTLNPLIVAELMPGDYSLTIDGFEHSVGEVYLSAYQIEPMRVTLGTIGLAQEIPSDFTKAPANVYIVEGALGKLVDFEVDTSASGFDSTLAFYDTWDMTVWVSDDDGGVDYGSRIVDTVEDASLIAVVAGFNSERGGAYELTVLDHAVVEGLPDSAITIEPGGPVVTGSLPLDGDIAWLRVMPQPDGWFEIEITSDDLYYFRADVYQYEEGYGYSWYDGYDGYEGEIFLSAEGGEASETLVLVRNTSGESGGSFEARVR